MKDPALLNRLAQQFGTPLYVYFEQSFREKFFALDGALQRFSHLICLAVKANSNLSIIKLFSQMGSGFDIVSRGELARAMKAGASPAQIVFSGVGKTRGELEAALRAGIKLINVESQSELMALSEIAAKLKIVAPIAFRINPDIALDIHPYIATGLRTSKFGIPISHVEELWHEISKDPWIRLEGIDCHIGSQITDVTPLRDAYTEVVKVAERLRGMGAPIRYLDFGGGLGASYSGHYSSLDLIEYATMLEEVVPGKGYEIILEPGKFLTAEAGMLLTTVIYRKQNFENTFVVVDAGMNDLIRPSLYDSFHHIEVLQADGRETETVDVVGPVCESGCFFAKARTLPRCNEGDMLAICDTGAYGMTMASHYNSRCLPAEVLVDFRGAAHLIRKRDMLEDLWRNEILAS